MTNYHIFPLFLSHLSFVHTISLPCFLSLFHRALFFKGHTYQFYQRHHGKWSPVQKKVNRWDPALRYRDSEQTHIQRTQGKEAISINPARAVMVIKCVVIILQVKVSPELTETLWLAPSPYFPTADMKDTILLYLSSALIRVRKVSQTHLRLKLPFVMFTSFILLTCQLSRLKKCVCQVFLLVSLCEIHAGSLE